jgi:CBS domain-containing protein
VRASDLQIPVSLVDRNTSAVVAARLIAEQHLAVLVVADKSGLPMAVVSAADVLGLLLPGYVLDDLALAGVFDESGAAEVWSGAESRTIGELLDDDGIEVHDLLRVDADATLVEVAAQMADAHAQIAVVKGHEREPAAFILLPAVMDAILLYCEAPDSSGTGA